MTDKIDTSREDQMVTVGYNADGNPIFCDPEIADLVRALNCAGVLTVASCSGHGYRPGTIALKDGRWLFIANDEAERQKIESLFPTDINGHEIENAGLPRLSKLSNHTSYRR